MLLFIKAQASSFIATLVDFLTTVLLVELLNRHYVIASAMGAIAGAITNFGINRQWTFGSKKESMQKQGLRYALVWTGSLLLNAFGLYLLTHYLQINYVASKLIVALIVGMAFNYVLQKKYVFSAK